MKVRNVLLSITLSAALIAGTGYAAYRSVTSTGGNRVEVAPVKNMKTSYDFFDAESTIYGSVTSKASQNIELDSEYDIDEIYVKQGDAVKEGDPLFSYDMRIAEIELEAGEIELATLELNLSRYQEELEKYKNGTAVTEPYEEDEDEEDLPDTLASLFVIRASAAEIEEEPPEAVPVDLPESEPQEDVLPPESGSDPEPVIIEELEEIQENTAEPSPSGDGIAVESVEAVSSGRNSGDETFRRAVLKFEELMESLKWFEDENGQLAWTESVCEAFEKAVDFYQKELTNRIEDTDNGDAVKYELKRNVIRVLSDEELKTLNGYVEKMEAYEEDCEAFKDEARDDVETEETAVPAETETEGQGSLSEPESEASPSDTDSEKDEPEEEENAEELYRMFLLMFSDMENSPTEENMQNLIRFYLSCFTDENAETVLGGGESGNITERLLSLGLDGLNASVKAALGEEKTAELENRYKLLCLDYGILLITKTDIDPESDAVSVKNELDSLYRIYESLPNEMKNSVYQRDMLLTLFKSYGIGSYADTDETETNRAETDLSPEDEDEPETEDWDDDWDYDDWGDDDWGYEGEGYGTEEDDIIEELEENIKECELSIREAKLQTEQQQRIVDGKIVTSSMDGVVVSIGDEGGEYDDYFVRISNTSGLYARGVISELELLSVNTGDTVSGVTEEGESFTAVIKEVSDMPDTSGSGNVYGSGNSNSSYYTFYALIDDPEGITEGDAELTLSDAFSKTGKSIWLDVYFVRKDSAGNSYVYTDDGSGKLTKQYVKTGRTETDWAIEITAGLSETDLIAFPYGDAVYEGAPTKEVDILEAYWE